ncbi:sterol desaturase family protein [Neptuniibacter sp. PT8_73]|uniref:sterol desaturase family protein n=1 Tax=Neptuniibacter sp. PT8_73 TaxID=3398206 RepID=UPI0039F5E2D3
MLLKRLEGGELRFGEGRISGYIAVTLALLSLLGVCAFHFPEYLTTPELRAAYDANVLRTVMFVSLIISGSLGLLNFVRNTNKRAGLLAWILIVIAIALGGHRVEVGDIPTDTPYIGLDWFILDLLGSTLIFIFSEKIIPHRTQAILRPEWQTDLHHFFVNHLIVGFVLLVANQFVSGAFGWAVERGSQELIQGINWYVQLFLVLLVADLVQYALHRVYHEVPFFWRFHAIHHSAKTMDWLAGSRQHIGELIATRCFVLAPIFVLGFDKSVLDAYIIIVGFQAVLNHTNAQINFGWLKYIIVTPQFHHWHHSSDKAAIDRNYAAHFAFIDYLFGTAVKGQKEWPQDYGVVGDYVPEGWLKQQVFPLRPKK